MSTESLKQNSRDTVPSNILNRRQFRVFKGLSVDNEEEGEDLTGQDATFCYWIRIRIPLSVETGPAHYLNLEFMSTSTESVSGNGYLGAVT